LPAPKSNPAPLAFEDLNQDYGFVLYRTELNGGASGLLKIKELRDYGLVFINGKRVGILDRRLKQDSLQIDPIAIGLPAGKVRLDILVENLGRINYGSYLLKNKKGITEKVIFNGNELKRWQMFSLPLANINSVRAKTNVVINDVPVFRKGGFNLETVGDSYLDMSDWGKGCVWINGHNMGRYWSIGPQQTIYVPAEWLKKGKNEIIVFELLKSNQTELKGITRPILNVLK
jgi:beta-galactosidase